MSCGRSRIKKGLGRYPPLTVRMYVVVDKVQKWVTGTCNDMLRQQERVPLDGRDDPLLGKSTGTVCNG